MRVLRWGASSMRQHVDSLRAGGSPPLPRLHPARSARRPFHPARLHAFLTSHFVLQEPDWSEALEAEAEHDHAACNGHHHHHGDCGHAADQQQGLGAPVQAAVLHASQAAQQAATALQTMVQQQAAGASSDPQQQALLATVAAATSAAAAASSAAAVLLSQLQAAAQPAGANQVQVQAQQQQQQQQQQQAAHGLSHAHSHGHSHAQPHYRQHGPAVSAEEAARRQERLAAECGQLCRSKGFVWLATRPDLCGEWSQVRRPGRRFWGSLDSGWVDSGCCCTTVGHPASPPTPTLLPALTIHTAAVQAGGIARLGVGGPWYAALPDEAWPQEEEARRAIRADFQEPHGDRRWGPGARGGWASGMWQCMAGGRRPAAQTVGASVACIVGRRRPRCLLARVHVCPCTNTYDPTAIPARAGRSWC